MYLPSYRLENDARNKSQNLKYLNGYMVINEPPSAPQGAAITKDHPPLVVDPIHTDKEVDDPTDVSGRYSIVRKKADRDNNNVALLSVLNPSCHHF